MQKDQKEYDKEKDAFLEGHGFKVLRFRNAEIMGNIDGVIRKLIRILGNSEL